jgi:hypothetical protein
MSINYSEEHLSPHDYIEFITRTDLGLQYPKERFHERIEQLLKNASVSIAARDGDKIVSVCLGLADFAYWLMITDLDVDRSYMHRGIGRTFLEMAHEKQATRTILSWRCMPMIMPYHSTKNVAK